MNSPLGVIFDMDGVLVDSYRAHLLSWKDTATQFGAEMTDEDFARTFGQTSRQIIQALWPHRFDGVQVGDFDAAKESRYRQVLEMEFPEMPGASDLIRGLHDAGFRLAIGSSGPPANVALAVRRLRHGRLIHATVNGTEVRHGKPNPDVFLIAARKLQLEPSACAVIEDAPAGIEAAKLAGMCAVALVGTAVRERLARRADLVVDSLDQLNAPLLASLIAAPRVAG